MDRERYREQIPNLYHGSYRRVWDKAMTGKSLRAAVTAKCQECVAWQVAEIKRCGCPNCPLYPYRPI